MAHLSSLRAYSLPIVIRALEKFGAPSQFKRLDSGTHGKMMVVLASSLASITNELLVAALRRTPPASPEPEQVRAAGIPLNEIDQARENRDITFRDVRLLERIIELLSRPRHAALNDVVGSKANRLALHELILRRWEEMRTLVLLEPVYHKLSREYAEAEERYRSLDGLEPRVDREPPPSSLFPDPDSLYSKDYEEVNSKLMVDILNREGLALWKNELIIRPIMNSVRTLFTKEKAMPSLPEASSPVLGSTTASLSEPIADQLLISFDGSQACLTSGIANRLRVKNHEWWKAVAGSVRNEVNKNLNSNPVKFLMRYPETTEAIEEAMKSYDKEIAGDTRDGLVREILKKRAQDEFRINTEWFSDGKMFDRLKSLRTVLKNEDNFAKAWIVKHGGEGNPFNIYAPEASVDVRQKPGLLKKLDAILDLPPVE